MENRKPYYPNYEQRRIATSFAHALEAAVMKYQYNLQDFVEKAITTEIFENYFEDFTIFIQQGTYIAAKISEELSSKGISIKSATEDDRKYALYYKEVAFWLGYLLMCWKCEENISAQELLQYKFDDIIWGYEVLHTQSIKYAIEFIKEEYRR